MRRVCVFCGSSSGSRPIYAQVAHRLGTLLAQAGVGLVYGGARVGIMGMIADSVLSSGGEVIGVLPDFLFNKELAHAGLTELHIVASMHERKAKMAECADAFIALPGGLGTFEEIFEMLTWTQLGVHKKPCGLLNVEGYFDPLRAQLDRAVSDGFLRPVHRDIALVEEDPTVLLSRLRDYQPLPVPKWLDKTET
jgi:uncharacterized protein (TIGR00730 family)